MKTLVLLWLGLAIASGQTNLTLQPFTNSSGHLVTNGQLLRVDAVHLYYKMEGGGGSIKLSALPMEMQKRFGYDPDKAKIVEAKAAEKRKREAMQVENERETEREKINHQMAVKRKATERTAIFGIVMKHMEADSTSVAGLLVDGDSFRRRIGTSSGVEGNIYTIEPFTKLIAKQFADGEFFLTDVPVNLPDGAKFKIIGYPAGFYEYKYFGTKKKVRRYSADLDNAAWIDP